MPGLSFPKYKQLGYLCIMKRHDKINKDKIEQAEDEWGFKE